MVSDAPLLASLYKPQNPAAQQAAPFFQTAKSHDAVTGLPVNEARFASFSVIFAVASLLLLPLLSRPAAPAALPVPSTLPLAPECSAVAARATLLLVLLVLLLLVEVVGATAMLEPATAEVVTVGEAVAAAFMPAATAAAAAGVGPVPALLLGVMLVLVLGLVVVELVVVEVVPGPMLFRSLVPGLAGALLAAKSFHVRQPSKSMRACMQPHSITLRSNQGNETGWHNQLVKSLGVYGCRFRD